MNQSEMKTMRYRKSFGLMLLCVIGGNALAQTTVPHTFAAGTAARAAEVNANFEALATAIDALAARVDKLEGGAVTEADVVGSYSASNLQIGLDEVAVGEGGVEAISYEGTVTFAADHTFSFTFVGNENDSDGPDTEEGTVTGTWSLSNNDLTFLVAGSGTNTLHCAAGCSLIFGTLYGPSSGPNTDGHNNLIILAKNK
jgi:hypothetical protein